MREHLAMRVDHLRALGMSEADAQAEALRRFGDTDEYSAYTERRVARQTRWHDAVDWVEDWLQDIRYAGRQFRRNVGFTALAVLTLALGIGANTAIFTVVHRLLIAPLPYPDGNRIVKLVVGEGDNYGAPDQAVVKAWLARAHSIENIAAVNVDAIYVQDFGDTQDTIPAFITWNYLRLLDVRPALGRAFTVDEVRPGAPPVAMISYGKWQREFGGAPDVLGKTIQVADQGERRFTIVGVTPPEMSIPMSQPGGASGKLRHPEPAVWLPASHDSIGGGYLFARLRPGVSARQASDELQAIMESEESGARSPRAQLGTFNGAQARARAMRAQDFLDPRETQTVQVLFVAVGVLLLIACANVANLLMSRAWTRRREFAVRTALGAGRGRLARQVLTESVLLALAGGVLGVGVAWLTLKIIIALRPPSLENLASVRVESTVLLWSAGISVLTGILFGCAPALFAAARSAGDVLRSETRGAAGGTAARRMRSTLIVLEIAMSLVLLVGAGLLVRSFVALQRIPLGFEPHGLVEADVIMQLRRDWSLETRASYRNEIVNRLRAMPGVTAATIGIMPGEGWKSGAPLETERDASGNSRRVSEYATIFAGPNYFRIAGMRLIAGRSPDSLPLPAGGNGQQAIPQEVVVSRSTARRLWPDGRVIGAHLYSNTGGRGISEMYTVVGIVEDIQIAGHRMSTGLVEIYQPPPARLPGYPTILLRTTLPEREAVASIRRIVADFGAELKIASGMPAGALVQQVTVGDTYLSESLAPTRFAMALLAAFAGIALVLSGVGPLRGDRVLGHAAHARDRRARRARRRRQVGEALDRGRRPQADDVRRHPRGRRRGGEHARAREPAVRREPSGPAELRRHRLARRRNSIRCLLRPRAPGNAGRSHGGAPDGLRKEEGGQRKEARRRSVASRAD